MKIGQAFHSAQLSEFWEALTWAFRSEPDQWTDFDVATSYGWYVQMEGRSRPSAFVRAAAARVFPRRLVLMAWRLPTVLRACGCLLLGHDLQDDGYGTPETGCIDINCHRCGRSFGRTVLY